MFERILIPLDGSPRAELILRQVSRILRRQDSEVLLLRVVDLPEGGGFDAARKSAYEHARGVERAEAHRYVHDLSARLADQGIRARAVIAEGPAATEILAAAKKEGATLIAMTTHGRTGVSRWFLGSVAEKVGRASPIPVLLVRSFRPTPLGDLQPAAVDELPFRRILVPTDGSAAASAAFAPAAEFAGLFDARVVILHVEAPVVVSSQSDLGGSIVLPPTPSREDPTTAGPAKRFRDLGLLVERRTVVGSPSAEILDQSHADEIDLIAMGTHGRSGLARWVLGSVAERVLRHSGLPLLLVRAPKSGAGGEKKRPEVDHVRA